MLSAPVLEGNGNSNGTAPHHRVVGVLCCVLPSVLAFCLACLLVVLGDATVAASCQNEENGAVEREGKGRDVRWEQRGLQNTRLRSTRCCRVLCALRLA